MMITLHPTYTLRVTIQEPDPTPNEVNTMSRGPFWDKINDAGTTGCDDVLIAVLDALKATPIGKHLRVDLDEYRLRSRGC